MYLGNNNYMTGAKSPDSPWGYHPSILQSDSIAVGKQNHIDNLLKSRYNYSEDWMDREKIEEIKKEIKKENR